MFFKAQGSLMRNSPWGLKCKAPKNTHTFFIRRTLEKYKYSLHMKINNNRTFIRDWNNIHAFFPQKLQFCLERGWKSGLRRALQLQALKFAPKAGFFKRASLYWSEAQKMCLTPGIYKTLISTTKLGISLQKGWFLGLPHIA